MSITGPQQGAKAVAESSATWLKTNKLYVCGIVMQHHGNDLSEMWVITWNLYWKICKQIVKTIKKNYKKKITDNF